ncbi:MAG: porin [Burkholderiaceae bacterium]|nr:porin [Burkholderiaceae bacterium]
MSLKLRRTAAASATAALASLLLAAVPAAQAQSTVTLTGMFDLSVGQTQNPGGAKTKAVESGRMSTSWFGVNGKEDLGGGLYAQFVLESFLRNDTASAGRFDGDAFWARSAFVGLVGPWGQLNLGRNTTSLFVNTLVYNAFGDSFGFSPAIRHWFTSGTTTGDTGWADSVRWLSPKMGSFNASAHVAAGEGNGGRNGGFTLGFGEGAFSTGLAYQKVKKGGTVQDTTALQLGLSYDFGPVKLFGQIGQVENDSTKLGYDISGLGVAVPVTATGKLLAQWGKIKPDTGASRTTWTLGYDYFLSKRTDLYAVYMDDKLGNASGKNYGLGMRHRF